MERTATCHCGDLRVIASGDPDAVYLCHCSACQHRTGAVVHAGSRFKRTQVRIEGAATVYERVGDSGGTVRYHFCPRCGTNLYWTQDRFPVSYGIAVGAFADPAFPVPTASLWEESKHAWVGLPAGITRFRRGRV